MDITKNHPSNQCPCHVILSFIMTLLQLNNNEDIVILHTHAKNMKTPKGTVAAGTATSISKIYFIKD